MAERETPIWEKAQEKYHHHISIALLGFGLLPILTGCGGDSAPPREGGRSGPALTITHDNTCRYGPGQKVYFDPNNPFVNPEDHCPCSRTAKFPSPNSDEPFIVEELTGGPPSCQ
jgi:hypothetical protein